MSEVKTVAALVKCDFPVKETVMQVDPKGTLGNLKTMCGKALELKEVAKYVVLTVNYGSDVVSYAGKADTDKVELKHRTTVFFRAPADIKPQKNTQTKRAQRRQGRR